MFSAFQVFSPALLTPLASCLEHCQEATGSSALVHRHFITVLKALVYRELGA